MGNHGEAEGYRKFLADQVLPMIAAQYRVDMHQEVPAGHCYNRTDDLVRDMQLLHARLQGRCYPGLRIQSLVLADEDHLSVNPSAFSRGLLWALSR